MSGRLSGVPSRAPMRLFSFPETGPLPRQGVLSLQQLLSQTPQKENRILTPQQYFSKRLVKPVIYSLYFLGKGICWTKQNPKILFRIVMLSAVIFSILNSKNRIIKGVGIDN